MQPPVNIILADDHTLFADGIRSLLEQTPYITVQGIASNGQVLIEMLQRHQPDLAILDISMPVLNGLEVTKIIRKDMPHIRTIILSSYSDPHLISLSRSYGADGYLMKTCNQYDLLQTITRVVRGESCFPQLPRIQEAEIDHSFREFNLTRRELEILHLINQQFTNQQIATHLYLSIYTVETHRKNIMQKLQLKSPAALTRFLLEKGL
ncbi:response regulator transcription factor [Chitinophaga pinensis]|uniref:Two component transcriptional regulator, LuxR family n=1 Tax=Chitinophaga pinensis (strain ATCC 43595 / DSM 2588 / LMG 13176 / NBRC 15968 / NCIMB 11800 / UQM 2034) TaxID=485918 RepID=A0A979GVC2_CHIPD|nr:response regulator transcription factor [Chitinophaga pinensis]ACU63333.1 two component transcriptional regulator, LuxR family [Chitinophaga pinensis DSM 2588]